VHCGTLLFVDHAYENVPPTVCTVEHDSQPA
jgi:hypothetical protein